ncbi:MAG: tRNA(Ile)-lysidine synthetase [Actinomycetota bacterium]|nr:tRNA(Ile)-lysidine synthetase [Actinomycetota bacterium]
MKCRSCRARAVVELRRHNAAFCPDCFITYCRNQVTRAIEEHKMIAPGERALVAVSGGKDSLALWDLLLDLGYQADGLYIGLGIAGYSEPSGEYARAFAERRGARLVEVDLPRDYGYDVRSGAAADHRVPCSACGLSKRHIFDRAALEGGYDVVVTGHNLDDEAAVLFGNLLRWDVAYLARQRPVLPGGDGFPRKVKPLVRLAERETAAYCVLRGIDYQVEECPMSAGNKHLGYKDALNTIEERSPGTKAAFYHGFLEHGGMLGAEVAGEERDGLHPCPSCGAPTVGEVCAFCRLVRRAGGDPGRRIPVSSPAAAALPASALPASALPASALPASALPASAREGGA